ncbi:MAG: NEW3 domain-containing protein [Capsulimonadaceae bacterium]|nr:NEW3 domain-containing protein [Capsulimonadaceae bacterium]
MKIIATLALLVLLFSRAPAFAQTYTQDFEHVTKTWFHSPPMGASQDGSSADVSKARAHSGSQSGHLSYKFSKRGNVSLTTDEYPVVLQTGNKLRLSVWIYGSGQNDFPNGGGLTLVDAGNETFLYWLGKPFGDALDGSGWKLFTADINVAKPAGHWGGKNTGDVQMPLRFLGFGLDHAPDVAAQGEIFIDDLALTADAPSAVQAGGSPVAATLSLSAEDASPGFAAPGTPVGVHVRGRNLPNGASVDWTAVDFDGAEVAKGRETLDASGGARFVVTPKEPGIVTVRASSGGVSGETQIAAYPVRSSSADQSKLPLLFGVCTHLHGLGAADAEREVAWIAALGFRACRFDCSWGAIEPEQGVWKWDLYDRIFGLMKKYGIEPLPVMSYSTKWASTGDRNAKDWTVWANSPPDTQAFSTFVRECALRYGSSVHYWEIWNEPDNGFWRGTPVQYAQLFDAAYGAIKAIKPDAVVMNGGISEIRRPPDFVPKWQAAAHVKPDVFAYHAHGVFTGMLRASEFIRTDLTAGHWTMPVWNNEAGFSSCGSLTEWDQALALSKKMSYAAALGDTAYFWYDLRNDGRDPNENEQNFGLLRNDWAPKAAAVAARTLIDLLSGYRFIRRVEIKDQNQVYALLFGAPDGNSGVISLWNEGRDMSPLLLSVPGKASRTALMGGVQPLRSSAGLIALSASSEPQFIRFAGNPDQLTPIPSPLRLPSQIIVAPGDVERVRIVATNSTAHAMNGTVTLSAPGGWRVAPSTLAVSLAPGSHKELTVTVNAPANVALRDALNVRFSSPSLPSDLRAAIELSGAVVVPRVAADPGSLGDPASWPQPVVSLGRANLVSLYQNAPLDNLLFHGDDDLSARVSVSSVPSGVRLCVRVRDDVHYQNEPRGSEWQGDSIQFAISLPTGENYDWTAALTSSGPVANIDVAPIGVSLGAASLPLKIRRDEVAHETLYDLIIPRTLPGGVKIGDRFSMTLLVNDNDGGGRKGWVEWTPGIGRSKDPSQYQPIVVR